MNRIFIILVLILGITLSTQGIAMALFFKGPEVEAVLFSPVQGRLSMNGEPAAGAELKLWIKWKDEKGETEVYKADEEGRFTIPKKTARYRDNPLAQIVITQEITVSYGGQDYLIWTLSKTNTHEFGELGGKPDMVVCELNDDIEPWRTDEVLMGTSCKWNKLEPIEE